jgi:hypothetical protein
MGLGGDAVLIACHSDGIWCGEGETESCLSHEDLVRLLLERVGMPSKGPRLALVKYAFLLLDECGGGGAIAAMERLLQKETGVELAKVLCEQGKDLLGRLAVALRKRFETPGPFKSAFCIRLFERIVAEFPANSRRTRQAAEAKASVEAASADAPAGAGYGRVEAASGDAPAGAASPQAKAASADAPAVAGDGRVEGEPTAGRSDERTRERGGLGLDEEDLETFFLGTVAPSPRAEGSESARGPARVDETVFESSLPELIGKVEGAFAGPEASKLCLRIEVQDVLQCLLGIVEAGIESELRQRTATTCMLQGREDQVAFGIAMTEALLSHQKELDELKEVFVQVLTRSLSAGEASVVECVRSAVTPGRVVRPICPGGPAWWSWVEGLAGWKISGSAEGIVRNAALDAFREALDECGGFREVAAAATRKAIATSHADNVAIVAASVPMGDALTTSACDGAPAGVLFRSALQVFDLPDLLEAPLSESTTEMLVLLETFAGKGSAWSGLTIGAEKAGDIVGRPKRVDDAGVDVPDQLWPKREYKGGKAVPYGDEEKLKRRCRREATASGSVGVAPAPARPGGSSAPDGD